MVDLVFEMRCLIISGQDMADGDTDYLCILDASGEAYDIEALLQAKWPNPIKREIAVKVVLERRWYPFRTRA